MAPTRQEVTGEVSFEENGGFSHQKIPLLSWGVKIVSIGDAS